MKKYIFLALILGILVATAGGYLWWKSNSKAVSAEANSVSFVIEKGTPAALVGRKLVEAKLIRSALAFKIYVQATGNSGKIFPGEYTLKTNMNLPGLVYQLLKGPSEVWVTIPEGLRREEIALKFASGLNKEGDDYKTFITDFLAESQNMEGYLFPDTYLFPKDADAIKVVSVLRSTFDKRLTDQMKLDISKSGYSLNQIITLASLIERETRTSEERPMVSGIILNRLGAGWPLQVDASVQYAVASQRVKNTQELENIKYWDTLTKDDLEIDSPYNLYKVQGLPPAPICSPGVTSLKAAIYPERSDYWYYLHDTEGNIHYSKTLEEHNDNVRKYLGK